MFNLIVSGDLSRNGSGSIVRGRFGEYTSSALMERFVQNGVLDIDALRSLPTLFMEEGRGDEVAWVGYIASVRRGPDSFALQYTIEQRLPLLTNREIYSMARELDIADWEFSRNHWAVKDVDLFRALLLSNLGPRFEPTIFTLPQRPMRQNLVSLMMPFDDQFSAVHNKLREALEERHFEFQRADDIWVHHHIIQDIIELISTSRIVVCDLSGKNPNVFYEVGIAHTLGKDVILITQSADDVPFDLRHVRFITYHNNDQGRAELADKVMRRITTITADD